MDKQTEAHLITIYELVEKLAAKSQSMWGDNDDARAIQEMAHSMAANLGEEPKPTPPPDSATSHACP